MESAGLFIETVRIVGVRISLNQTKIAFVIHDIVTRFKLLSKLHHLRAMA